MDKVTNKSFNNSKLKSNFKDDATPSRDESSRGGGSRGRGKQFGAKSRGGQNSNALTDISKTPDVVAPPEKPKPKAISVSSSVLKNDPMLEDAFVGPDGPSLTPISLSPRFSPSFTALDSIVAMIFTNIQVYDKNFRRSISHSMLAYYCQQHLMARVIAVRQEIGITSRREDIFLAGMKHGLYPVPGILDQFFRSIGEFTMLNGTKFLINLPDYSEEFQHGGWGKVDADTQVQWMNYPHPFIYARRIQQDIMRSNDRTIDAIWNLPDDLCPDPIGAGDGAIDPGLPTSNLCGWHRSVLLTNDQLGILDGAGITTISFDTEASTRVFFHNKNLMLQVGDRLKALGRKYSMAPGPHLSIFGSVGQQSKTKVLNIPRIGFDRSVHYLDVASSFSTSVEHLDARLAWGAIMFAYRLERDTLNDLDPWSCYDWNDYQDVPQTWINNRNVLLHEGVVDLINIEHLRTNSTPRLNLIVRACDKSLKRSDYD